MTVMCPNTAPKIIPPHPSSPSTSGTVGRPSQVKVLPSLLLREVQTMQLGDPDATSGPWGYERYGKQERKAPGQKWIDLRSYPESTAGQTSKELLDGRRNT